MCNGGELFFELGESLLELGDALAVAVARGFEIADADFEGFALAFSFGGFGLPSVTGPHQLGDEDAGRSLKRGGGGHGAFCPGE